MSPQNTPEDIRKVKNKMKLKTEMGFWPYIRFWKKMTLIMCQMTRDWGGGRQGLFYGPSWFCLMKPNPSKQRKEVLCVSLTKYPRKQSFRAYTKKEMVPSFFYLQDADLGVDRYSISSIVYFPFSLIFIYLLIWRARERFNQTCFLRPFLANPQKPLCEASRMLI